jgi:hypothetical protein
MFTRRRCEVDGIKDDKMKRACSTNRVYEKCLGLTDKPKGRRPIWLFMFMVLICVLYQGWRCLCETLTSNSESSRCHTPERHCDHFLCSARSNKWDIHEDVLICSSSTHPSPKPTGRCSDRHRRTSTVSCRGITEGNQLLDKRHR